MIEISIINKGNISSRIDIFDVFNILESKFDRIVINGFYFSGIEYNRLMERYKERYAEKEFYFLNNFIDFHDTTFYTRGKVKESTKVKKYNRFELMDI